MSKENDTDTFTGRLWSGGRGAAPPADEELLQKPRRPAAPDDRVYEAYSVADRPPALEILRAAGPSRFPSYSYLLDIVFDHHLRSAFTLVYTFMIVEVTGCDLAPIVHAINARKCETIREFSKKPYDPPAHGAPIIEKIQITAADEKLTTTQR
jgi:hypothetical protein